MPYFSNEFNPQPPASFTLSSFRGINRALPEEALYRQNGCYTHKGVNFWIEDGGVLTVRPNYAALFANPITVVDGVEPNTTTYTCKVKSAHVFCSKADDATPLWLLGCDMQIMEGEDLVHHHYALVYGALDGSSWAECKTTKGSMFGEGKDLYFSNADFSFVNFTGNYEGKYTDDSVAICTNGADIPVAFLPYASLPADQGLYEVKSPGWNNCDIDITNNVFDWGATTSNKYQIEFFSRTREMPGTAGGPLVEGKLYFMRDASEHTFKIAEEDGGTALDITSTGNNVMARLRISDYSAVAISASSDRVTVESKHWPAKPKNGDLVKFYAADPDDYPDLISGDVIYYCRDVSKYTFKITDGPKNKAYNFAESVEADDGLTACRITNGHEDCPKGELVFEHDQRLWMKIGNTLYHSDSFYKTNDSEYAHSRDWTVEIPELRTGSISILTFDGDAIKSAHRYGPENIVHKENSFWRIVNRVPPYGVECVFSVKGTIAPRSVCQWKGNLIYAVADGIQIYNGASSGHLLSDEIKGIWSSDNEGCICAVAGDTLYAYANLIDPLDEDAEARPALLAVDLPTKNVSYWTLDIGETALPEINAVLDPVFSTLLDNTDEPLFVFASGNQLYRVETVAPGVGEAVDMVYCLPQNNFGDILRRKTLGRMSVYGSGGTLVYMPVVGTTEKTEKNIALPEYPGASRPVHLSLSNVMSAGAKLTNSGGSVPRVHSMQTELSM